MGKIVYLMGKSSTGKDTIFKKLLQEGTVALKTIVPYTTNTPSQKMENWLQQMRQSDIQLCVVSNSKRSRVKIFCEKYGIDCISHAKKPFSKGIKECLARYQIPKGNCALVGDQIFTDILAARLAGLKRTFLVPPIKDKTDWLTQGKRMLEKPILFVYRKKTALLNLKKRRKDHAQ